MAQTYASALATIRAASKEFRRIQAAYRSGEITTVEFLAAREVYLACEQTFDADFLAEQGRDIPKTADAAAQESSGYPLF
jgi:predicted lipid-binding transport protein (Tim44 family)